MRMLGRMFILVFGFAGAAAFAQDGCSDSVFVNVDEANMTVGPKTVAVCRNGTVTWQSAGPSRFQIVFPGPRAGPERRPGEFVVVVDATSAPGEYPYRVMIRGEELDPTIIIR